MSDWNTKQYLLFDQERTQPAIDLLMKSEVTEPKTILDVGCGPGNSTKVLKDYFPNAKVLGIDSSSNMIEKAKQNGLDASFMLCDASKELNKLNNNFDFVFSNACIQWIPNHTELMPALFGLLSPGGTLAVQIPMNGNSPLYQIIDSISADSCWGFNNMELEHNEILDPEQYFDILSKLSASFSMWETVYYHKMKSHQELVEWIKGTRLRPYLNALDEVQQVNFLKEIYNQVKSKYSVQKNGDIIFGFTRFFFTVKCI